ncbi:glycosyltransferase [Alteraurantiacibacter aquimixticola]|uniref:Glycosyltransferase n=1 Tax=Alteraurantiacibacter aquimixticola TaxID=2489173 RepID=A0A4T3F5E3_9SPHN|nr:glycosyltransferase [Alteraurantiacibacter aquimixticola]
MPEPVVALFAKYPHPGKAKTRLIPALGPSGAAHVHRLLVERTIATIRASGLAFDVWFTGAERADFAEWLGDDVTLVDQGEGDLGARLTRVGGPAILLGADVPDLAPRHLRDAASALERRDAVIGPASDGGYYLLGFNRRLPFLFTDMPWGTDAVLAETLQRLSQAGVEPAMIDELEDCDRPADLARWPELLP